MTRHCFQYDLLILGAGSGGIRAARTAANYGAKVGIVEMNDLGGTCVNAGCIPKKILVYAAHFAQQLEDSRGFGWQFDIPEFNWDMLKKNQNAEIQRLNTVYEQLLNDVGVEIIRGQAHLYDAHTLQVSGQTLTAQNLLIATGGAPIIPKISGGEHVIVSDDVFLLETLPQSIIIVGGGYIALEFASIFHGLNVDTTLIYRDKLFLRGFDYDLRIALAAQLREQGIKLFFDSDILQIRKPTAQNLQASMQDGRVLCAERILYAIGRKPMTAHLGLEKIGIKLSDSGAVEVNQDYQTNIPSVYAIGDVTDRLCLTPVALAEGERLAKLLYANQAVAIDYDSIPSCVFSLPHLATVGLTEAQAQLQYGHIRVYRSTFKPMNLVFSKYPVEVLLKIIVDDATDHVLGIHMLGMDAPEIIQALAVAFRIGLRKSDLDQTLGIHPTVAEEFLSMRTPITQNS